VLLQAAGLHYRAVGRARREIRRHGGFGLPATTETVAVAGNEAALGALRQGHPAQMLLLLDEPRARRTLSEQRHDPGRAGCGYARDTRTTVHHDVDEAIFAGRPHQLDDQRR
jgi:hypothetical protein